MTNPSWPNQECPVYISALMPGNPERYVQVMREDGTITHPQGCRNEHELHRLVEHERSSTDLSDPGQVCWVDHPGEWSGI